MTAAYSHPDWNEPQGTNTGPNVPLNARKNLRVSRDHVLFGKVKDWTFERVNGTGTADQPQYWRFKNAVNNIWFRLENTWAGNKITAQAVEWSDDAGVSWASVLGVDAITYDASLNITSQTIGSGMYVMLLEVIAKLYKAQADLATHVAGAGTAVHGLGNMSTQAKTAVDVDGGNIDGTKIGINAREEANFLRTTEGVNIYAPGAGAGQAVDWMSGGSKLTNNGVNAVTFNNVPVAGVAGHVLDCSNFNNTTFPAAVDWGLGGKPGIAGRAVVSLITNDGGAKVFGTIMWRAV